MGKPKKFKAPKETSDRNSLNRLKPVVSESDYSQVDATAPFSDRSKARSIFGTTSSFDSMKLSAGSFEESASIFITDGDKERRPYEYVHSTIVRPISGRR
jgi:hypothetical protein